MKGSDYADDGDDDDDEEEEPITLEMCLQLCNGKNEYTYKN